MSDTPLTQVRSVHVRYRLLARDGLAFGPYPTAKMAAERAAEFWPDEEQDPDRTGKGWDIEAVR